MKKVVNLALIVCMLFSLCGCPAAPFLLVPAAFFVADVNSAMKGVDFKHTIETDFDTAWKSTREVFGEMEIEITEEKLSEDKKAGVVTGKTEQLKKIQVVLAYLSPAITEIGIKARKTEVLGMAWDNNSISASFAAEIYQKVAERCEQKDRSERTTGKSKQKTVAK